MYIGIHRKGEFSLSDLLKSVKAKEDFHMAGAIATFIGVVRGTTLSGEKVTKMDLQAY